jgi:hypothetical protein
MRRSFRSPFVTDGHQRSMKHASFTDSGEFSGDIELPSRGLAKAGHPRLRTSGSNSLEMKIWAVLFALIILASITLIVVVMMEESAQMHGTVQSLR